MAVLKIPDENRTLTSEDEVRRYLASRGIEYERVDTVDSAQASPEELLRSYGGKIDDLKARGGYVTADVIDVKPETPNLDTMLKRFSSEHWHDEDEVRLIVEGRGVFHIHPPGQPVFAIEVSVGDLIRVPKGTHHWFDLCSDRRIRAIRLFQDVAGWTPHYTETGVDTKYQPLCLGPSDIPVSKVTTGFTI